MSQDKNILLIVGVIAFLAGLVINLAIDYKKILDGGINHKNISHWLRKAAIMSASVVVLAWATNAKWLWALGFTSIMCMAWFWMLFNVILNLLRGEKWHYRGTKDPFDSTEEKAVRSLPIWLYGSIQLAAVFTTTYVYIKLLD